jgi:hypothetical protein
MLVQDSILDEVDADALSRLWQVGEVEEEGMDEFHSCPTRIRAASRSATGQGLERGTSLEGLHAQGEQCNLIEEALL